MSVLGEEQILGLNGRGTEYYSRWSCFLGCNA